MDETPRFVTVDDYEPAARAVLPSGVYDYYAGGAGDEWTVMENRRAFDRWVIRPRVLRGLADPPDLRTSILGVDLSFPVLIAPWAWRGLAHADGDLAMARAAAGSGTVMTLSSTAYEDIEVVAGANGEKTWFQLYLMTDRVHSTEVLGRVAAAGYGAIVWTVDVPVLGLRHRDTRSGFQLPVGPKDSEFEFEPGISWDDLGWIRARAPGIPVLVKGILTHEDAGLAVEAGVDGIVVSNHGGRQLDGVTSGIGALPEVLDAVAGRVPVLVDGGIRRGTDVLKALALGADAVMVARPTAWGLAVAGEEGVIDVLRILRDELENAMWLAGCGSIAGITRGSVAPAP
jgi:isopentenyl diphosphate isomerase/L-lactate dehydrogenase-like FMN-dependent dehydrogenase